MIHQSISATHYISNQWSRITMISAITNRTRSVLTGSLALALLCLLVSPRAEAQPVPSGVVDTVTTLVDELDASADPSLGSGTSLREAIAYSSAGDSIVFDAGLTGTIFLHLGEITVGHDLILSGPGSNNLELNGNDLNRIFVLDTSAAMALSGLTLASGRAVDGAAIQSFGWLSIENSIIHWSTAIQRGGAIYQEFDTLRLTATRIMHCESYIHGGAVALAGGALLISQSSFADNTAGGDGGALFVGSGTAAISQSGFITNTATGNGGAVAVASGATLSMDKSTLERNYASSGGGINNAGTVTLTGSTISGNNADNNGGGMRTAGTATTDFATIAFNNATQGGGVHASGSFSPQRTLIADNGAAIGPQVRGAASSQGHNLVSETDGSSGWTGTDVTGTSDDPASAALDDLRLNGGVTRTHALLICSEAIDAASAAGTAGTTDQRGSPRNVNGDNNATPLPDIGAYEVQSVLDNVGPIINGHPSFTVYLDSAGGTTTIAKDTVLLSAYDNCGIRSTSVSKLSFTCADIGQQVLTLTAVDNSYNQTQIQITVTVKDDTAPTLTIPSDKTVNASASSCGTTLTAAQLGTASAFDGCGGVTITNNAPPIFPVGITVVLWTATDGEGNQSVGTQTVTVNDVTDPTIAAPADLTINTVGAQCSIPLNQVALGVPTVSDNCNYTVDNNAPAAFPLGTTTVTWTAIDASGNSSNSTQDVTVVDATAPILFAPADLALVADTGSCSRDGASVSLGTPTASDNCTGVTVTNNKPASFPIGDTDVTWTAIDGAGNTTQVVQKVTVYDANPPSVVAPPNIEVGVDPGTCYWTVDPLVLGSATSYDNCSVPNVTNSAGVTLTAGTHRVIWTALDANGNRSTDVQIVTVVGDPPSITCVGNITTNTDPGLPGAVVNFAPPTAASSCSEFEIIRTDGLGSGDFFPVGMTTVAYMAIDASNQIAVCSFDVTVIDNEDPQITVNVAPVNLWPANNQMEEVKATVEVWDNVPGATAVLTSITSNENINGDVKDATTGIFDVNYEFRAKNGKGPRTYTVLYTATDVEGNTSTASAVVTVPKQKPKDFEEEVLPAPQTVTLEQNYPNPFNPSTLISFGTPVEQHVELRIYNTMGRHVRTLVSNVLAAGSYTMEWDGRDDAGFTLPSGVYLYMIRAGGAQVERKMILAQ